MGVQCVAADSHLRSLPRDAHVAEADVPVLVQEHVERLDVAMQRPVVVVHVVQGAQQLKQDPPDVVFRQALRAGADPVR